MLLAIDIGNTHIVLGLYQGKKRITHWRLLTEPERTADEYGVIISHLITAQGFRCDQIHWIVAACVRRIGCPTVKKTDGIKSKRSLSDQPFRLFT